MNLFKNKKQQPTKDISEIYQLLNIEPLNHCNYISNKIANINANLFNGSITYNNDKIESFLEWQLFQERNWVNEFNLSLKGSSAYVLLSDENTLQLVPQLINQFTYDFLHNLTSAVLQSHDYVSNDKIVRVLSTYEIGNNVTQIDRAIYEVVDDKIIGDKLDYYTYVYDNHVQEKVTLKSKYLPIVVMSNLPSKMSDTNLLVDKINILDAIWEQILLDCVLNSPKFVFGNLFSNNQTMINRNVKQLITKNYLFNNNNPNDNPKELVSVIQGNFKGKQLTNVYDWYYNSILQDSGVYQEVNAYDTIIDNTNSPIILQKIKQRKVDLLNLVKMLIKLDNDLFDGVRFNIKDSSTITLSYNLVTNMDGGK